jgi:hypothetical protein
MLLAYTAASSSSSKHTIQLVGRRGFDTSGDDADIDTPWLVGTGREFDLFDTRESNDGLSSRGGNDGSSFTEKSTRQSYDRSDDDEDDDPFVKVRSYSSQRRRVGGRSSTPSSTHEHGPSLSP